MPFAPIVSAGPNSANPHASPTDRKLQPGDLLVVDWGAAYDGYISDLTRTFAVGEVDEEYQKIHRIVQEANAAGLRATSAICTAFENGVKKIIPVSTLDEAFDYKKQGFLVAAERDGSIVEGFHLGNSPFSYMDENLKDKTIVLTTTNGTKAINAAKNAHKVAIGSFLNLNTIAEWLCEQERNVILLCAGWKDKFNMEDSLFAGALAEQLLITKKFTSDCDSARASVHLWNFASEDLYPFLRHSSHRNRLGRLNLDKDIRYCLTPNQTFCIPVLEEGVLIKLEKDLA